MCPLWLTGFCPKGAECDYTHPRFEAIIDRLRIKPDEDAVEEKEKVANGSEKEDQDMADATLNENTEEKDESGP